MWGCEERQREAGTDIMSCIDTKPETGTQTARKVSEKDQFE